MFPSDCLMQCSSLALNLLCVKVNKAKQTVPFNLSSFCQGLYPLLLSPSCLWSDTLRCSGTPGQAPLSTTGPKSLSLHPGSTHCSGLCLHSSAGAGQSQPGLLNSANSKFEYKYVDFVLCYGAVMDQRASAPLVRFGGSSARLHLAPTLAVCSSSASSCPCC